MYGLKPVPFNSSPILNLLVFMYGLKPVPFNEALRQEIISDMRGSRESGAGAG
jgi:hypothetical protein